MKKIGPKIDSALGKKPVDKQPLKEKPAVQPKNTVFKKNDAVPTFRSHYTNYSTGMRV